MIGIPTQKESSFGGFGPGSCLLGGGSTRGMIPDSSRRKFRLKSQESVKRTAHLPARGPPTIPEDGPSDDAQPLLPEVGRVKPLNMSAAQPQAPQLEPRKSQAPTYRKELADFDRGPGNRAGWNAMISSARAPEKSTFQKLLHRLPELQRCFEPEYGLPLVQLSVEIESVQAIEVAENRITFKCAKLLVVEPVHACPCWLSHSK
jgi:hypothetical protein